MKLESAERGAAIVLEQLKADDPVVRAAAATGLGELKPANGAHGAGRGVPFGQRDCDLRRRAAAALRGDRQIRRRRRGAGAADALADKDWAVRVRAAALLKQLDPLPRPTPTRRFGPAPTHAAGRRLRRPRG